MASKRPAIHIFSVFVDYHGPERSTMPYMGISEYRAALAFYRAVRSAGGYQVTMRRSGQEIAQVTVKTLTSAIA